MPISPRGVSASPRSPNRIISGDNLHGSSGGRFRKGTIGTIVSYQADRYTATIKTDRQGPPITGVPRLRSSPGDIAPLTPGTQVLISEEYGQPVIMGVLATPSGNNDDAPNFSITDASGFGGQGDDRSTSDVGNFREFSEPTDLMPGDWVKIGEDGNAIGVLGGGVNVIRSSPMAQIRTYLLNDLVELISRNYRHITDMGEFNITNNDGRLNLSFRGSTDQRSEAGPDEEKWTIKLDIGSEGDVFNLEFTTPAGQTLFKFHVDAEGHAEIYGIDGVDILSGNKSERGHAEEHTGNSKQTVLGNHARNVDGNRNLKIKGNHTKDISGDHEVSVSNDARLQVLRDLALSSGRSILVSAQGPVIPGGTALTFDVENGDCILDIGSFTSPLSGLGVSTYTGDIDFESVLGGNFNVETLLGKISTRSLGFKASTLGIPDSVVLGGEALVSHVVKWEELILYLNALHLALDTHIHPIPGTAFGIIPITGVTTPPVIPIGSPLSSLFAAFRSLTTGVQL